MIICLFKKILSKKKLKKLSAKITRSNNQTKVTDLVDGQVGEIERGVLVEGLEVLVDGREAVVHHPTLVQPSSSSSLVVYS